MSDRTFTYGFNPNVYDHGREEFYRAQDNARRLRNRTDRASHWLGARVVGMTFASHRELRAVCIDLVATQWGEMDDELAEAVTLAVDELWSGIVADILLHEPTVTVVVTDSPRTVRFYAARAA